MKFLKVFLIILFSSFLFVFFGGWMLFEFTERVYLTTAVLALIVSAVVYAFVHLFEKVENLEKCVKELEDKRI